MDFNITFFTLVYIVFLIIPGVFFKRFYFQGHFNKQFQSGLYADRLITSVFWGAIIQVITIHILLHSTGDKFYSFSEVIKNAFLSISKNDLPNGGNQLFTFASLYLIGSVVLGGFLGHFSHQFIRKTKLDLQYAVLRFSNKWYYYFTGDILYTNEFKYKVSKTGKIASTVVDVLVDYGEGENILFTGTLTQYSLDSNGNLETLYLTGTSRFKKQDNGKIELKNIPGDCFVIPYQRVLNMNIDYVIETSSKEKKQGRMKRILLGLISAFLILLLPVIIVVPWFSQVGVWLKLSSIVLLLLSWLFFMVGFVNLVDPKAALKGKGIALAFVLFLILLLFGLSLLGIFDHVIELVF
ncbi:hypothetical protein [Shivajiella indica]|uniref:LptF/LptG family permease n=1 Tax=Shivajiella indica TaxID=872115 RepID=A0ABW5B365_9BACT